MYASLERLGRWRLIAFLLFFPLTLLAGSPSLQLRDLNGKPRNINEYIGKGRWVVVAVWSADCPICERTIYHMTFLHEDTPGLRVIGMSIDGPAKRTKAQTFVEEQGLNFPNFIGLPGDAARLSGQAFVGTPTFYFFAPDGRYATQRVGALTQSQAERALDALKKAR